MNKYGYVYKTTNLLNNKIYIGKKTAKVKVPYYYGSGKLITYAIKKYGKVNFNVRIIKWAYSKKELCKLEKLFIKKYNSTNRKIGYNICTGGEGGPGLKLSKKIKRKIGKMKHEYFKDDKNRKNMSDKMKAFYKTERGKERSKEMKNKVLSKETKEKIRVKVLKHIKENPPGPCPKERALKISKAHLGKKTSIEARIAMSKGKKGRPNGKLGSKHTEETKLKMKEAWERRRERNKGIKHFANK